MKYSFGGEILIGAGAALSPLIESWIGLHHHHKLPCAIHTGCGCPPHAFQHAILLLLSASNQNYAKIHFLNPFSTKIKTP